MNVEYVFDQGPFRVGIAREDILFHWVVWNGAVVVREGAAITREAALHDALATVFLLQEPAGHESKVICAGSRSSEINRSDQSWPLNAMGQQSSED
ncbi:hypothetical protein [Thauera butanivorans]|uniref:hypothetical protein n=1 Tax=Thauera butanivorans TaxID=86174 RepID=UPI000837B757|nr:hypothetical protein [Thauera butanivorans]